jgi:hypothetical protein
MMKSIRTTVAAALLLLSSGAMAGEITGPPPLGNGQDTPGTVSNGNSLCSYSGLNDTPDGVPGEDPGGQVQSYGYFMSQFDLYDPSDAAQREMFAFPGVGCNPHRTFGTH